jgi:anti-anti-sigma regulatory factor
MSSGGGRGLPGVDTTQQIVVTLTGRPAPGDAPRLCAELSTRLTATGATEAICDVGGLASPDLTTVDILARLRLTAQRHGCHLRVREAAPELTALLRITGLTFLTAPR